MNPEGCAMMDVPSMLWMHSHLPNRPPLSVFEKLLLSSLHVPITPQEGDRLNTLYQILSSNSSSHVLNDQSLDSIVGVARRYFKVAIAAISLVDLDWVFSLTCIGLAPYRVHRNFSLCSHAILSEDVIVILDASKDVRVQDAPLVACEGGIRFYAGAPIIVDGQKIGALCIIDPTAREETLTAAERATLLEMAGVVSDFLSERRKGYMDVVHVYDGLRGIVTESLQPYLQSLHALASELQQAVCSRVTGDKTDKQQELLVKWKTMVGGLEELIESIISKAFLLKNNSTSNRP
eukprot:gene24027-29074_t